MKKLVLALILGASCLIYAKEKPDLAKQCAACHGADGRGLHGLWPNIAGQHAAYLIKQMQDMRRNKERKAPTMDDILLKLTDEEIDDLAAYYAKMPIPKGMQINKSLVRGQALYRSGDYSKKIMACVVCHGPKGIGNSQAGFPVLSGQHAVYILRQLQAFKTGTRSNDMNHVMREICSNMSQEDMEALASYIEGLD